MPGLCPEREGRAVLELQSVSVEFPVPGGTVRPVDQVSLTVGENERHVIIGETGSGKSVLLLSILGISGGRVAGQIRWNGRNLLELSPGACRQIWGKEIAYIPQGNAGGLNPLMRIGTQIAEPLRVHLKMGRAEANARAVYTLEQLGFPSPGEWARRYPHHLSGGMKQRALVAMGTAAGGRLLLADEPTKGLDETRRDDVTALFAALSCTGEGLSLLCVTHDLSFAKAIATHIHVMYAGQILESSPCGDFFRSPLHPYAQMMIASLPEHGFQYPKGFAPSHGEYGSLGCRFAHRCTGAQKDCFAKKAPVLTVGERQVRCRYASCDSPSYENLFYRNSQQKADSGFG